MSRISSLFLADIVESCGKIKLYLAGKSFDDFMLDSMLVDAVVRNLEIIGEAVKNLPPDIRAIRPEIDWKRVARFRDVIAHHYFKIDYKRVWNITQDKLDKIENAAKSLLAERIGAEDID